MNGFLRRVRLLQERLSKKNPSVTLIYDDGTERLVGSLEAVSEIIKDHSIVDIRCTGEGQSFFSALLESEQEYGESLDDLDEY